MEKVKVNKEVFEALVTFENTECGGLTKLVRNSARGFVYGWPTYGALNELTFEEVLDIYKHGYELEETPEEKALKYYNKMCPLGTYTRQRVYDILNILEIKIKGINE